MPNRRVSFHAPLNPEDTEKQTLGCRANNPDICLNCMTNACALYNSDGICYRPSRKWKQQYLKLKAEERK